MPSFKRREALAGTTALAAVLAGCTTRLTPDGDGEDLSFDRLHRTPVYVDPNVELSLPSEVSVVERTDTADLLVLPGDTAYGPDQAADWLDGDRVLALLGAGAERRWLDWAGSETFQESFENRGLSDAEPDPTLLVGAAVGEMLYTYRHSWGDTPRNRDVLRALDEDLVDIAERTPT